MADDLTNVPDIVRKQAEEALKLFNAAASASAAAGHPIDGAQPEGAEEPVVDAAVPAETKPAADSAPGTPTQKVDTPPAEETGKVESLTALATEEMTKEQRYKIMEGMQKAAGRDLSRALASVRALREEVDALKTRPVAAPAPAAVKGDTVAPPNVLREQVAEAFGADNVEKFFQLMRQEGGFAAREELDEIRGEVGNVARNVVQSTQDKFHATMENLVPGWLQINEDPKFIAHMDEEEGNTGLSRLEFAKRHLAVHDAPRLAAYFAGFAPSIVAALPAPKLDKKKFAAPPATPGAGKEPEEKSAVSTVKASDMARFAREVIIQKYNGNDKVMNEKDTKTWSSYLEAQRAGRVIEDK